MKATTFPGPVIDQKHKIKSLKKKRKEKRSLKAVQKCIGRSKAKSFKKGQFMKSYTSL